MFLQKAFDDDAELGAHVLSLGPVDGDVAANGIDEVAGNLFEGFITEDLDGAVVHFKSIVEGEFVVGEAQVNAASAGFAHLFSKLDQFLDDLGGGDGAVLVTADGGFQHFREGAGLNHVFARSRLDLVVQ